MRRQQRCNGH